MKKFLSIIILGVISSAMIAPAVVSAQPATVTEQCCQVRASFTWTDQEGVEQSIENGWVIAAEDVTSCSLGTVNYDTEEWAMVCTIGTIYTVTNWIFFIMMALAVIMIVIGGVVYMTAGGSPDKAGKGKNIIVFAIIGLAIALIARFIPPVVKFIMGVS